MKSSSRGPLAILTVLLGCSSSEAHPSSGDVCSSSSKAAFDRVEKVVSDNLACAADTDCVVVNVNSTCFDACTRAVNQTGKGAVDRASTLVEASECKAFHDGACKLVAPPCAPPQPARCVSGHCE